MILYAGFLLLLLTIGTAVILTGTLLYTRETRSIGVFAGIIMALACVVSYGLVVH